MAAKKSKRPGLRYLLSADSRLRRLSIKKLTERGKTAGTKRPARTKAPAGGAAQSLRWPWTANPHAIGLALVGVIVAATLMAAGQMSDEPESTEHVTTTISDVRLAAAPSPARPARAEKAATPSKSSRTPEPSKSPVAKTASVAPVPPTSEAATPASVTITGCLAKNGDGFWLKNASGADLSGARSWRTGFFKKGSPRVNVIASTSMKLSDYVGQRVSATGILEDQTLRARSLRRVATSCD